MTKSERLVVLLMAVALAVMLFCAWSVIAHAEWSPRWHLYLDIPVKDSPTPCDGESIDQADGLISRVGWLERSFMNQGYVPQPGTLRRVTPGDTLTVSVVVWNFGHKFTYHTQGLYERTDGSKYWVADAECDTLVAMVWQGHAWFPFVDGNKYQVLEPVEGGWD